LGRDRLLVGRRKVAESGSRSSGRGVRLLLRRERVAGGVVWFGLLVEERGGREGRLLDMLLLLMLLVLRLKVMRKGVKLGGRRLGRERLLPAVGRVAESEGRTRHEGGRRHGGLGGEEVGRR